MVAKSRKKKPAPVLLRRLRKHFGCDPAELPVVEQQFGMHDRPNLHLAVEEMLGGPARPAELLGVMGQDEHQTPSLARLSREATARYFEQGPVEYADVPLPAGRHLACVKTGLYLIREEGSPLALLVTMPRYAHPPGIRAEIMAADRDRAEHFVRQLQRLTNQGKAYRGHVLSLEQDCYGNTNIRYHALPAIRRDEILIPTDAARALVGRR